MVRTQNSIDIDDIINYSKQYKRQDINDFRSRNNLNSFTVMTIGRLQDRKKIEWLIDAIKETRDMGYNFKLVIIGNGEKLIALKEKILSDFKVLQIDLFFLIVVYFNNSFDLNSVYASQSAAASASRPGSATPGTLLKVGAK